ncbi:MAG: ABC transporter ATP-binding protein [Candidatus Cloacimonetes bacterium]|nr:ABC transporter ATP-binding protein [Candidatus Cloacimonadota bacterium]
MIELEGVKAGYGALPVLQGINLTLRRGEFCAVLGPNGAGKSTLLKAIIGWLGLQDGSIRVDGQPLEAWSRRELAKRVALIPQELALPFDHTVHDLVLMGRFPYLRMWQSYSPDDLEAVQRVLERLELDDKRDRPYSQLSGGEQRRVSIARALAQDADAILLDESLANLDLNHQLDLVRLLRHIQSVGERLVVLVSHNLNLAAACADRLVLLHEGRVLADGPPREALTQDNLRTVYGVDVPVTVDDAGVPAFAYPPLSSRPRH